MRSINEERAYIGRWGVVAIVCSNVIGSGIFSAPSAIIQDTTSIGLALAVWLFTGLISLTGALTYAELAATIRISGGDSTYVNFINWKYVAYFFAITNVVLIYPTVAAIQALSFASYLFQVIARAPAASEWTSVWIAVGTIVALGVLNFVLSGPQLLTFNVCVSIVKILLLLAMIVLAFVKGNLSHLRDPFANSTLNPDKIVGSFYNAWFAFDGYDLVSIGAEEILEPQTHLPFAVVFAISCVTVMYLLVNLAYAMVMGTQKMIRATDIMNVFAALALGKQNSYLMLIVSCVCLLGAVNMTLFAGSRITHALARDNVLPNCLSGWHERMRTPRSAFAFQVLLTIAFMLSLKYEVLIELSNVEYVAQWIQRFTSVSLLLFIRVVRMPVPKGVHRMNVLLPTLYFVCLFALILSTVAGEWTTILFTLFTLGGTSLVYFVGIWPRGLRRVPAFDRVLSTTADFFIRAAELIFRCEVEGETQPKRRSPLSIRPAVQTKQLC